MTYIGISSGLSGAIVAILPDRIEFHDMPTMVIQKKKEIDYLGIMCILKRYPLCECILEIEEGEAIPGKRPGIELALGLKVLQIPFQLITSTIWQRCYRLIGGDREALRKKALEIFPECADNLNQKKRGGRTEALLLAYYLRFQDKVKTKQSPASQVGSHAP